MKFENPYPLGPYNPETHARINAEVPKDWYMAIRAMVPTGGIQTTVCILWSKLEQLCKTKGINNVTDRERFMQLVSNINLTDGTGLSGSSVGGTVHQADARNDRGRKTRQSNGDKGTAGKQSKVQQ